MLQETCSKLREMLESSVQRNLSNSVLLSGGLDSSIITSIASKMTELTGITVAYDAAPDLEHAKLVALKSGIRHLVRNLTEDDLKDAITHVIRIMKTFDPMEVRNTAVLFSSLKELKSHGFSAVMTGDGGDELFIGYNYMLKFDEYRLESELQRLWSIMHFSSLAIGKEIGIVVNIPFLDCEFMEFAKTIPIHLKIKEHNGERWGKWILRRCFEDVVTERIAWRKKMPLEEGAGITMFSKALSSNPDESDLTNKLQDYAMNEKVSIRDGEQLHYYAIYRKFFDPPSTQDGEHRCPSCNGSVEDGSRFCRTCGAFPIKPIVR